MGYLQEKEIAGQLKRIGDLLENPIRKVGTLEAREQLVAQIEQAPLGTFEELRELMKEYRILRTEYRQLAESFKGACVTVEEMKNEVAKLQAELEALRAPADEYALQGAEFNLASALAAAVVNELESTDGVMLSGLRAKDLVQTCITKYATRYFVNAQDTSDKLVRAYSELHTLRATANKQRLDGMKAIINLAQTYLNGKGVMRLANTDAFLAAAHDLYDLNQPRSEDASDGDNTV